MEKLLYVILLYFIYNKMDFIQLFVRLIAFGVTLFLLLEYVFLCKVKTYLAFIYLIITIIIVLIFFFLFKKYDVKTCKVCNTNMY